MDTPKYRAIEILNRFKTKEDALICVEEITMALHEQGIIMPEYWHNVEFEMKHHLK